LKGLIVNRFFANICRWSATLLFINVIMATGLAAAEDFSAVPLQGKVTLIDLGADKCIPCKMMAPIMAKLEKVYEGRAAIVFIDVWKHNEQAKRFGIRAIPTQIFYDKNGREVYRHVGFMDEKAIVNQLKKMGID
jgi:thioredoxin 1